MAERPAELEPELWLQEREAARVQEQRERAARRPARRESEFSTRAVDTMKREERRLRGWTPGGWNSWSDRAVRPRFE